MNTEGGIYKAALECGGALVVDEASDEALVLLEKKSEMQTTLQTNKPRIWGLVHAREN